MILCANEVSLRWHIILLLETINFMKSCFMFGHRDVPNGMQEKIARAVERLYCEEGITSFYVGRYGEFDRIAGAAVRTVQTRFPEIMLFLLLPYHPAERPAVTPAGYDGTFYPPIEKVPRRYAIVKANQYMVSSCDAIICLAKHPGNSRKLLEYAQRIAKYQRLIIENIEL